MTRMQSQPKPAQAAETILEPGAPLLDRVLEQTADRLDSMAGRYAEAIGDPALGTLRRAILTGQAIEKLRAALTPDLMRHFMALMNTPLGFKTDRPSKQDKSEYSEREVRECLIGALLNGVFPFNNEFNIIAGNLYIAQEGYRRKVREIPGLTDLVLSPGTPLQHNGQMVVRVGASWKLNGVPDSLRDAEGKPGRVFPIIAYQNSTPDNLVGKAVRKALKAIYQQATGSDHGPADGEVDEAGTALTQPDNGKTRTEALAERLGGLPSQAVPDVTTDAEPCISGPLRDKLADAIRENKFPVEDLLKHFRVPVLEKLPACSFEAAMDLVQGAPAEA